MVKQSFVLALPRGMTASYYGQELQAVSHWDEKKEPFGSLGTLIDLEEDDINLK